ncbi:MAG: hypothetical protein EPN94_06115 [Nitrospirae bacterium]|nr:MAG: hypothetical protein EPN94_06115 [Nitrospirota bacterium]
MHIRITQQLKMVFSFALLITLLVVVLELINWAPSVIETESLRKYKTIELVKRKLHIERVYIPAYLPEDLNLKWPPSEIYAQKKPFVMVITHFQQRDSREPGLIVHQVDAKADYRPESKIKFRVKRESKILIKDREGMLVTAICEDETPCNQVSWREGNFMLTVIGKNSQRDIIRIARSMIPDS